jgi:enoyl-CoA hydratase/carnithine racemase
MQMLNPYCGVDRDSRGVVRLTICNAGSLNILGSAVINGVREGLEVLATERQIRVLVVAGQSEKSMIGGADIKEMAKLDQASAEKFITGLRGGAGVSGTGDRADARLVPWRRPRIRRGLRLPGRRARCAVRDA